MIGPMLSEAWHAMGANRLRTFLTMLGMVIGVGAVVMMQAVGKGAQYTVEQAIASMGSNLYIVLSGPPASGGVRFSMGGNPTLTLADAQAIAELPHIAEVGPIAAGSLQLVYGPNNWNTQITGTTPNFFALRGWQVSSGYIFTDADVRAATRVALVGQTVVKNLFNGEDPVGKTFRIQSSPYLVIGVLEPKGQSLDGRDQDDAVYVPVTTAQRKLFGTVFQGTVRYIMVQVDAAEYMADAEQAMQQLLRQRHHIRAGMEDDFNVRNLTAMASTAAITTKILSALLGAIASISLLVGGIGIMNIMLVSVTERTREIGIRAAIGARRRDILLQFLLEAIVISLAGCLVGVIMGIGGALLFNRLMETTVVITLSSILLAFTVAAAVGIFFGFYPARRASRLKPIEALRYQ